MIRTAGQTMDFKSGDDTAMALDLDRQDTVEEPTTGKKAVAMDKIDEGSEGLVQEAAGEALRRNGREGADQAGGRGGRGDQGLQRDARGAQAGSA